MTRHPEILPGCQQSAHQNCQVAKFRFPAGLSAVVHVGPVEAGRPCSFSWCRLQMIRADDPDTLHCMNFDAQSADMIPMLHILMDQGSTANAPPMHLSWTSACSYITVTTKSIGFTEIYKDLSEDNSKKCSPDDVYVDSQL